MYRKPAVQLASSYAVAGLLLVAIFWAVIPAGTFARIPLGVMKDGTIVIGTTVLLYAIVMRLGRSVQSRYELMFANNPNPMMIYHRESFRILAVNDIAIAHYGYSRDEFLSMTIMDIRPPEDVPALREHMSHVAGLAERNGIWRHTKKDGTIISVEVASHDIPFNGQHARLCCINDVTRLLRSIADLEKSEQRYRALTEQSIAGVYMLQNERVEYVNKRAAEILGYTVADLTGRSVRDLVAANDAVRLNNAMQRLLSGGVESIRDEFSFHRKDGVEIVIGAHGIATEVLGKRVILGMMQDISEVSRSRHTIRDYAERLERTLIGTLDMIARMVELRDPYTGGHEARVGELAAAIGREMGLDDDVQRGLRIAGAVHDVGKITVPVEILSKPGTLSAPEYLLVQQHAQAGYDVLKSVDFPWPVAEVARQHHERLDGSGYPRGLKGTDILLEARIIAVADVVESMAARRPYRAGLGVDHALQEIEANAGKLYDPDAVTACLRLFRKQGYRLTSVDGGESLGSTASGPEVRTKDGHAA